MKNHLLLTLIAIVFCFQLKAQQFLDYNANYYVFPSHANKGLFVNPANNLLSLNKLTTDNLSYQFVPHPTLKHYFWIRVNDGRSSQFLQVKTSENPLVIEQVTGIANDASQLFRLKLIDGYDYRSGGKYNIYSKYTEDIGRAQVMGIEFGSSNDYAKVILWWDDGSDNQKFEFRRKDEYLNSISVTFNNPNENFTISTNALGGKIIQKETGPLYDEEIMKDTSLFNVMTRREFNDFRIRIEHENSAFTTNSDVYLNGQLYIREQGSLSYSSMSGPLVGFGFLPFNGEKAIPETNAYNLFTIKKSGKTFYIPVYVVQQKVITEILGSTLTPEFPQLILHDPPGDESYSYLKANSQTCHGIGMSILTDTSVGTYASVRLGAKGSLGFIAETEYEVYGELSASATMGMTTTKDGGHEVCFSTQTEYSTAGGDLIGTDGDVYIGFAQGLDYGLETELEHDFWNKKPKYSQGLSKVVFAPSESIPTTKFVYTESHIKNTEIPKLVNIRDNPTSTPEAVQKAEDQLLVWNKVLGINQNIQNDPGPFVDNISFSAGTGTNEESEASTSSTESFVMNVYLDAEVGVEIGAYVGGSGAAGGVKVNMKTDLGRTVSNSNTYTNTIGYVLKDDDYGDYFTANVYSDKVFGTPIFKLVDNLTRSSCPYEGGLQRQQPKLSVAPENSSNFSNSTTLSGQDPSKPALFRLKLENLGDPIESDSIQTYYIKLDAGSNPDGAGVLLGSTDILGSNNWVDYDIPADTSLAPILLSLFKGPNQDINNYGPLKILLYSPCEPDIQSTVTISANFSPTSVLDLDQDATNLQIAPNPNNGVFSISLDEAYQGGNLEISDLAGKVVFKQQVGLDFNNLQVQLPNARPGMYIVRAVSDAKHISKKLIVR
jgi:hypothetical protein